MTYRLGMPLTEWLPEFLHYVREQYVHEDGYTEPQSNVSEEYWEPASSATLEGFAEALAVCLELYHDDHTGRMRTWVETLVKEERCSE